MANLKLSACKVGKRKRKGKSEEESEVERGRERGKERQEKKEGKKELDAQRQYMVIGTLALLLIFLFL